MCVCVCVCVCVKLLSVSTMIIYFIPVSIKKGKTFIIDSPNPSSATRTKTWLPGPRGEMLKVKFCSPEGEGERGNKQTGREGGKGAGDMESYVLSEGVMYMLQWSWTLKMCP